MSKESRPPTPTVEAIGKLHLEGNIVPHTFYARKEFKSSKGITQHIAILIYADDLYWYRPTIHRDELTGQVTHVTRKFQEDMLQRSYEYYAELFGITKQQATDAVKFNVDRGLTRREFRTIRGRDGKKVSNVMYVEPVVDALNVLLELEQGDGRGWHWVPEAPKPNLKKEKGGGIPNKTDTYPEHSVYLSQIDERRIRSKRDTNTKTTQETSPQTSSQIKNPSSSEEAGQPDHVPPPPDDDELSAVAAKTQNPTPKAPDRPAQVETQGQGGQARPAPDLENVPAAGGAAGGAILALRAISLAELDQREARDPTTNKTLRALMQASDKSRLTHLQEQLALTTQGPRSIPRHYLTRLTDEEIEQARVAAQTDAKTIKGGMGRAGYYALDALIGEQYTLERLTGYPQNTGRSSEQPVHRSHQALNSGKVAPAPSSELEAPLPDYLPGAMWRHKKSGEAVLIKEKDGTDVVLTSGARLFMGELVLNYKLEVPGSLPAEASA